MGAHILKRIACAFGVIIFCSVLISCVTTRQVNYTSERQPRGEYQFAVISANSFSPTSRGGSVLNRFYNQYPSDKYLVIAIEKLNNDALPSLGLLGGFVLFATIGGWSEDAVIIAAPIGAIMGYIYGSIFKDKYIVTYVERPNEF